MKAKFYLFLFIILAGMHPVFAQDLNVTGTVVDESGEPLLGASVLVKGTQKGQMTDLEGRFHLSNLKASDVLVVSYVGMKKAEVAVKSKMTIKLYPEAEELDEVIVTAFGTAKKSAFTGSATVLNNEKIEQKQVTNVMSSLIGEVTGLQIAPTTSPGSTSDIVIRGEGSINADNDPLIILDGVPYDGGWNNINPSDVESITVLKDAASNALYGARGANGVIIITTKKGAAGKALVTVNAKWGVNQRSTPDYDRITDPGQYYEMYYKALYNYYTDGGSSAATAHRQANETLFKPASSGGLGYNVYTVPNGEYLIGTNGRLNPNATLGRRVYKNGQVYTMLPDDWTDETYQNGFRQEYNVSVSGGNEAAQIYASFGYLNDEGIVDNSAYERYTTRLRASYQAKKWLQVGANVSYIYSDQDWADLDTSAATTNVFSAAANMAPIYPLYVRDENGNFLYDSRGRVYDWGDGVYNTETRPQQISSSPLQELALNYNNYINHSLNGDGYVDISFLKDFKFTFKAGMSMWDTKSDNAFNPYYGYYASLGGVLSKVNERTTTLNLQQLLNWNHSYGKHNVSAMLGHEYYKKTYETMGASKTGAVNFESNRELNGYLASPYIPTSYKTFYNTEGYFFRGMYDYDGRYYAQVSFRRDASSRFHPDNRWGNFWSAGGAWLISKENWFNVDWVDNLKFKISYGEQGNDNIGSYRYVDTYVANNVNGELSVAFSIKGNKDITWETNQNFNMGIEFDLFKHRLSGSVEFYNRLTSDMLFTYSVPATLGYSYYYKNIGDLRNRGIEVSLSGSPIRTRNIDWSLNANLTYNNQKVVRLPEDNQDYTIDGHAGYISGSYFVGEGLPLYTYLIPRYAGLSEDGCAMWYDKNDQPTTDYASACAVSAMGLVKTSLPVYGGFGTSLKVYDFDFSAQFTYSIGGKGYDTEYAYLMTNPYPNGTGHSLHKDLLNAWTPENSTSVIPKWQYGNDFVDGTSYSDRFLISNTYVAFQNCQIGYTLPKRISGKFGLSKLRVYATADNICLWSKRKGYDPRLSMGYGSYSPMRTISGGINIQF